MQLQLKYSPNSARPVNGAFAEGREPESWFLEMDLWQIDLQTVSCYIMPESIAVNAGAGLFVVFNDKAPAAQTLRHPYSKIAGKLFIPQQSVLYPFAGTDELKGLLLWDVQVFHPSIGLVGFEKKDEVSLSSFISVKRPKHNNWNFAHPGLTAPPAFYSIGLEPEENADVMEAIKEDVSSKPLNEIPSPDDDKTPAQIRNEYLSNFFTKIGLYILLLFAGIGTVIFTFLGLFFPFLTRKTGTSTGLIKQLENWINQKLESLEKQRDSELKRLVNLFDQNTDEALQYAIPLSSPYLNRGDAPKSGTLSRRPTDFNLRNLGGGGRVDGWNVDAYANQLRTLYERSATQNIQNGNFKKAAYIYAHLLGNFYAAANVLQQGKYYREAAALFKDHLRNERMAAECLEKGGLLDEAIPLYVELRNFEKAGDLYEQLGRHEDALKYYGQTVTELKNGKDYQKAATLTNEKMHQKEAALNLLLEGWKDNSKPEACLKDYFKLGHDPENNQLVYQVKSVYASHVSRLKKTPFLNVLADINLLYPNQQLNESSLAIAYEIAHQQVGQGDTSGLKLISRFIPGDRLLATDANRFINSNLQMSPVNYDAKHLELRKDTEWISITSYHDQLLAIGLRKNELHFMRANWDGKITYQYLFIVPAGTAPLSLVADPGLSDQVLIAGVNVPYPVNIKMEAYSYFDRELWLRAVNWLPGDVISCCLNGKGGVTVLSLDIDGALLSHFKLDGELLGRHAVIYDELFASLNPAESHSMVYRKDHYYICIHNFLIRLTDDGYMDILTVDSFILKFGITGQHTALKIALLTSEGCLIVTPLLKEMKISSPLFATEFEGADIKLLPDNKLVIAGDKQAAVYDISGDTPKLHLMIATENPIKSIIAAPKRHHCAFLEADNRVSVYNMERLD